MSVHDRVPSSVCARFADLLPLLDGSDADIYLVAVEAHVGVCAYCQAQKERYYQLDQILRQRYGLSSVRQHSTEEIMRSIMKSSDSSERASHASLPRPLRWQG